MLNIPLDSFDEQRASAASSSEYTQEWSCRECTYINKSRNNNCEMCDTPKPKRLLNESHLDYTRERLSRSPSVRPNRPPSEEPYYNRADYISPPRNSRKLSSSSSPDDNSHPPSRNNTKQTFAYSSESLSPFLNNRSSLIYSRSIPKTNIIGRI